MRLIDWLKANPLKAAAAALAALVAANEVLDLVPPGTMSMILAIAAMFGVGVAKAAADGATAKAADAKDTAKAAGDAVNEAHERLMVLESPIDMSGYRLPFSADRPKADDPDRPA